MAPEYVSRILLWKIDHPEVRLHFKTTGETQPLRTYDKAMEQDVQSVIDQVEEVVPRRYFIMDSLVLPTRNPN